MSSARYNTLKCPGCKRVTSVFGSVERVMGSEFHGPRAEDEAVRNYFTFREFLETETGAAFQYGNGMVTVPCRGCGTPRAAGRVMGRLVVAKKCDAKCTHATGHKCECSCGGRNHGAAHQ